MFTKGHLRDDSSFEGLLINDNSLTIHEQNLKRLAIEMYKTKINQNLDVMNDIFRFREPFIYSQNRAIFH